MKQALFGLLLVGLIPAGYARAQPAVYPGDYSGWSLPAGAQVGPPFFGPVYPPPEPPPPPRVEPTAYRVWARADYLLWFVSGGGPRTALVTTDINPGTVLAGSLISPTSVPLFGNYGFDYRSFSGTRLTLGGWLDAQDTAGLEWTSFLLERRSPGFSASSSANGNPALYVPAFNVSLGREDALLVADPKKLFAGNVAVASPLRLWGTEFNGVYHLVQNNTWDIQLLGGFRYIDLGDSFLLENTTVNLTTEAVTSLADHFQARNQFYGGQLGIRASAVWGRFTTGLTFQTALGNNHEMVAISGSTTSTVAPTFFPGGFFAQPSNSGRRTEDAFAVVPQVGCTFGYRLTQNLTALAGYDFLYWSDVVRAGNEVDRSLNLSQNPILGGTGGALVGPARPSPQFSHSGFIAHGLTLGLLWQY
jgi:hypothetical protein